MILKQDIQSLSEDSAQLQSLHSRLIGSRDSDLKSISRSESSILSISEQLMLLNKLLEIFKILQEKFSDRSIKILEDIVNSGLEAVFGRSYIFKITTTVSRNVASYDVSLNSSDITSSFGGGVVTVIGVILRILCVVLLKPKMHRFIILDESISMLSRNHIERMSDLMRTLCQRFSMDILMITHSKEFVIGSDKIYKLSRESSVPHYAKIESVTNISSEDI